MTLRVVFAGTPEFSIPSLRALLDAGHQVVGVFTQPDRPAGRGRKSAPSPVKRLALEHDIAVYQPNTLKGQAPLLESLRCDVMVVVAYGLLLPRTILDVPRLGCINVHASLLPRWRGAAPIARAIEAGDRVTGVTIMLMDEGLDTGPILAARESSLADTDTAGSVHERLAELGADLLLETLRRLEGGFVQARPQGDATATFAPKLSKDECSIDWARPAEETERKVRALHPWPVAQIEVRGQRIRIWGAVATDENTGAPPGSVVGFDPRGVVVQCGQRALILTELQREGGKRLRAMEFVNGFPLKIGERLNDGGRP